MLFRPLATPVGVVLLAALMGDRHGDGVEARSPAFFQKTSSSASFVMNDVASSQRSLSRLIIDSIPRGGAEEEADDDEEEEVETEILYLPGLLEVELTASDHVSVFVVCVCGVCLCV